MGRVWTIQYLRAFAALGVVTLHFALPIGDWFPIGTFGVDIFFVVSGFIIWIITAGKRQTYRDFLIGRAARIVPTYYCVVLLTVAGSAVRPWLFSTAAPTWPQLLSSMLFIPYPVPVVPQSWTLNIEVFFYLLFAATLHMRRAVQLATLTVCLAVLAIAGFALHSGDLVAETYLNPRLLEFLGGLWIGEFWLRGNFTNGPAGIAALVAGLVLAVIMVWVRPEHVWLTLSWIVSSAAIVAGVLTCEHRFNLPKLPLLALAGDASYLIYLVHNPIVTIFRLQAWLAVPLQLLGALGACLLVGISGLMVERPMNTYMKRLFLGPPGNRLA